MVRPLSSRQCKPTAVAGGASVSSELSACHAERSPCVYDHTRIAVCDASSSRTGRPPDGASSSCRTCSRRMPRPSRMPSRAAWAAACSEANAPTTGV
eukprot:2334062-Prymnesium_polylepis.1